MFLLKLLVQDSSLLRSGGDFQRLQGELHMPRPMADIPTQQQAIFTAMVEEYARLHGLSWEEAREQRAKELMDRFESTQRLLRDRFGHDERMENLERRMSALEKREVDRESMYAQYLRE